MPGNAIKCDACQADAAFVRCTQFAGNHFFCPSHAKLEKGFGQPDETGWHHEWTTIERYLTAARKAFP